MSSFARIAALASLSAVLAVMVVGAAQGHRGQAGAATPKRGGTLTFARAFEPVTFDPLKTNGDNGTLWTIVQIYDQLVEYQPGSFVPQPGLAQSWTITNGGKTITFKLRHASFSNGAPVTAADVVNALTRFANPKTDPGFAFLGASIASAASPAAGTVVLNLKYPDHRSCPRLRCQPPRSIRRPPKTTCPPSRSGVGRSC